MAKKTRKRFTAQEKVAILRLHLLERTPVSDLCDKYGIHPTMFYRWQKELFENGHRAFQSNGRRAARAEEERQKRIDALEARLQRKDGVIAQLMEEHVQLKKSLGEP